MSIFFKDINYPVGKIKLVVSNDALVAVLWEKEREGRVRLGAMEKSDKHPLLLKVEKQLSEYFCGERKNFDLPLKFEGTKFQNKVWNELRKIPYGTTNSYEELAVKIGLPYASRAVGAANGRNPLSIIVPCHRVIGKNGSLTGFAGGLDKKAILLKMELL